MSSTYRGARLGTQFGPYELRSLIGVGGMGEVYRAHDTIKGRMVAVKVLRTELAADPSFQERFRRESRMAARLQEPHVIPVHDFGDIRGVLFIDMRLVDGGSLKDLLRAQGALEPVRAARIIAQVAAALDAAHAEGLVHRDIKPENVLLTRDDFAYLVDFGIAHSGGDASVTASGSVIGSCAYMATERFTEGRVGPQADVYSLACVLYECLTGETPFEHEELQQVMSAHMFSPPPRPSIMRRGIGRAFDDVIAAGMAKEPAERFSSAGELARAATEAASTAPSPSPTPPTSTRPFASHYPNPDDTGYSPYPPPPPPPARPGRSWVPLVLGGAAVLLLAVAGMLAAISMFGSTHHSSRTEMPSAATPLPTESSAPATKTPSLSQPVKAPTGWGSSASRPAAIRAIRRRWWCEPPCHSQWCVRPGPAISITAASGSVTAPTSNSPTRCAPRADSMSPTPPTAPATSCVRSG